MTIPGSPSRPIADPGNNLKACLLLLFAIMHKWLLLWLMDGAGRVLIAVVI
jgi:hypothetical protein